MATREDFTLAFELLLGHEGAFSGIRTDPGNWTSGRVGVGELRGTKWGISAAAYPHIRDIRNLRVEQARDIYFDDYWTRAFCHEMPPRLAFVHFDAAVNNGPSRAVRWLQQAIGAGVDGVYGPQTRERMQAAVERDETHLITEYHAHRLRFMVELTTWGTFRGGWSRRLVKVPFEAAAYWPRGESVTA
ncbi:MAG: secretion activator protein [Alphaproteobacteria bacterium]|nr:secretion activator protein [Alphaproteobacteria bacterium]